jgi:hypothetical protein
MIRLRMFFGRQCLSCRVTPAVADELVNLFCPDSFTIEGGTE